MLTRMSREMRKVTTLLLARAPRGSAMIFAMTFVVLLIFLASGLAIVVSPVFFLVLVMLLGVASVLTVISNTAENGREWVALPPDRFLQDNGVGGRFRDGQGINKESPIAERSPAATPKGGSRRPASQRRQRHAQRQGAESGDTK